MGYLQIYKDAISEKQREIVKLQKIIVDRDKEVDRLKEVAIELLKEHNEKDTVNSKG